jgi:hypothetical protein
MPITSIPGAFIAWTIRCRTPVILFHEEFEAFLEDGSAPIDAGRVSEPASMPTYRCDCWLYEASLCRYQLV